MTSVPLILNEDELERGGKFGSDTEDTIENDFNYRNNVLNATKEVRIAFIRKVYGLLTTQILLTVLVCSVFIGSSEAKLFVQQNDWILMIGLIASFVVLIALHVYRKEFPSNLILLAVFTVVEAYTVGTIVTYYDQLLVLQALIITLTIFGGITIYTLNTKRDFTFLGAGLFAGLCALLIGGILQIFIQSTALELIFSVAGAFLFSLFILYDTHLMMEKLSAEEYIFATISLYLDIINLFLHILRILQASRQ